MDQEPVAQGGAVAPAPQAPQSVDERIRAHAEGFLADLDANDDPDQIRQESQEVAEEAPAETQEQPEAETPIPEVPMVEVELDGQKYQIPEPIKHRVMADKDYRQKTMEVAATKKQLEQLTATATQLAQQAQQLAPYHAQLFAMENHAQFLNQKLRSPELANDPLEYNRVQGELAVLLHQKGQFSQGLQQQVQNLTQEQMRLRAHQLQLEAPKLFEQFPDLQKPENQQKLAKYVHDEGLPQEAIDFLNFSAAGTKLAWKAHQYDLMVADQAKARAKLAEKTKTLPAATQSSRAVDQSAKDKQARSEWQKRGAKWNDPAFSQVLRGKIRG